MINKIYSINNKTNVMNLSKPVFKGDKNIENSNEEFKDNSLTQALTNYWAASINLQKKYDLKPLESKLIKITDIDSVSGKRIYTSDGDLHSIVDKNENTTTYYYPSEDDENIIEIIIVEDNKTKNVINKEIASIKDGKINSIDVYKYSSETGDNLASTNYKNNNLKYFDKKNYLENGLTEIISYDKESNEYSVTREHPTKNISHNITYRNGLKDVTYSTTKETKRNTVINTDYNFYNGALISKEERKTTVYPNLQGQEPLMDKDVQPHEKIDLSKYPEDMNGERTYYSNGKIESIKNEDLEVIYSPKGFIKCIITPEFELDATPLGRQIITEKIAPNITKITHYYIDDTIKVDYKNGNSYKELWLDEKSRPYHYGEGEYNTENEETEGKSFWYKNGALKFVY